MVSYRHFSVECRKIKGVPSGASHWQPCIEYTWGPSIGQYTKNVHRRRGGNGRKVSGVVLRRGEEQISKTIKLQLFFLKKIKIKFTPPPFFFIPSRLICPCYWCKCNFENYIKILYCNLQMALVTWIWTKICSYIVW